MKKIFLWLAVAIGAGIFIIVALVTTQLYLKRGIHGNLRESADYIGTESNALFAGRGSTKVLAERNVYKSPAQQIETNISIPRKLIRKAELNLEVKNCEEASKKITDLVNSFSGIIIELEVQKYPNESKRGRVVLKVQPKDFNAVIFSLKKLGKVDLERITGEDVTEEYVDLEARLKNFQVVKARLHKILEERAREVKDILEVERELTRVGEQIERIEGRMKYLDRQVELATVTVNYYESRAISPEPLNIIKRFKETLRTAIEAFINVFNGVIVVIAALLPIIIWSVVIIFITLAIKKLFRK